MLNWLFDRCRKPQTDVISACIGPNSKGVSVDLKLSEEQTMLKDMVRSFVQKEFGENHIGTLCAEKRYPQEFDQGLIELGLLGLCFPEKYNGSDLGALELGIVLQELARYSLDLGMSFGLNVLGGLTILAFGKDDQIAELIPELISGRLSFSCGYYEPFQFGTGTKRNPLGWAENGKLLIKNRTVYAERRKTDKNFVLLPLYRENGPALLVLSQEHLGKPETVETLGRDLLGLVKYHVESIDRLSDGLMIEGENVIDSTMNWLKFMNLMSCIGNMETVIENTIRYSKERIQFNKPIGTFQAIQHMIVDSKVKVVTSKLFGDWVAWLIDRSSFKTSGLSLTTDINIANTYITKCFEETVNAGLQVMGGYGYMQESHMERYVRDARSTGYYVEDAFLQKERISDHLGIVPQERLS